MGQLKSEPAKMVLDFSKGFSWYAVIKITKQKQKGRKAIFEVGHLTTPLKLTIGLDEDNNLKVWFTDVEGKDFSSKPIPKDLFFDKFVVVNCEVIPGRIENELAKLVLGINNDSFEENAIDANLGSGALAQYAIGATLAGTQNAAFLLAELMQYERIQNTSEKKQLRNYIKQKYGI